MLTKNAVKHTLGVIVAVASLVVGNKGLAQTVKINAQSIVEEIKAAHPEITGLELAAARNGEGCKTIAATEAKEVGEKCDKDELTAKKTNRPYVEEEKDEFDVTLPIHDSTGRTIATAGMDFKREAGRTRETVARDARKIGAELEKRFPSDSELFRHTQ